MNYFFLVLAWTFVLAFVSSWKNVVSFSTFSVSNPSFHSTRFGKSRLPASEANSDQKELLDDDTVKGISTISKGAGISPPLSCYFTGLKLSLPRHESNGRVNKILNRSESILRSLHHSAILKEIAVQEKEILGSFGISNATDHSSISSSIVSSIQNEQEKNLSSKEKVFANSYVDLAKVDTIGFDFDYTLVTYSKDLLSLIYDMALERLVRDKRYPVEMKDELTGKFDPSFSIRGLAVDRETGWICHLSYTHKVAVAWEGRKKVNSKRLREQYNGRRSLSPVERKKRLKPLNDLFSMAECCLIADTIQFFQDRKIPFFPRSCVEDVLNSIAGTHVSGEFHRLVARNPQKYFELKPHLASVLNTLKKSGKKLLFVR